MKKKLLLALLGGVFFTLNSGAQTWTGCEPQAGDYYLYNVGSGMFLTSGNWWGTHAALDDDGMLLSIVPEGEGYQLSTSAAFNGCWVGNNAYLDNGTAATWIFTPVSTGTYTLRNGDNYLYYESENNADLTTTSPEAGQTAYHWQLVTRDQLIENMKTATPEKPVDASFFMLNPKNRRNWKDGKPYQGPAFNDNGTFNAGVKGLYAGGCTSVGQWHKTFDNYQALADLPNGRYRMTVKGFNRYDGAGSDSPAYLYANEEKAKLKEKGNIGTDNAENATRALVDDTYLSDPVTVEVRDGNLRVGVKSDAQCGWVTWREFTIKFLSPEISFTAEALPESGDMKAGQWYYVDIPMTADNYMATATTLSDIVFTTDGTILREAESDITAHFTANNNHLEAGRYYIKSSTANNISIEVEAYSYEIGAATSDYQAIQGGETVTIAWPQAISNDPTAEFAMQGNPNITFNGSNIAVTFTNNGFTFTVPAVEPATEYTLSVPAGAFGYANGNTFNEELNITLKAPAIFDGTAFLKDNASGLFLARGMNWGTRAYLDQYGTATRFVTDKEGYTTISFVDTDRTLFYESGNAIYCDGGTGGGDDSKWLVTLNDGKYRLTGKNRIAGTDYVKYDESDASRLLWANIENKAGENIIEWVLVDAAGYAEAMTALKNSQAATAAQAAKLTAATPEELDDKVKDWKTLNLLAASPVTTTAESFKHGQTNPAPITIVSGEVTVSTPGLYKFSLQGFFRMRSNEDNYQLHANGLDQPAAYVYFGDTKTQICSVFDDSNDTNDGCYTGPDGKFYPNSQASAKAAFLAGKYVNTVWKFITQEEIDAAGGTFEYGIKYQGWPNCGGLPIPQWCCWAMESADIALLANNYIYETGAITSDYNFIQGSETVTIAWPNANTNDPEAEFAMQGTPDITFGGNSIAVTPADNGFTFEVPTVEPAKEYTLSIPAGAFGYAAGNTFNEELNITFNTPAIFDGKAFLKDNASGLFLARGMDWGTRAYLDQYGTATQFVTDKEGYTIISFVDTDRTLFYQNDNTIYCDGGTGGGDDSKWMITLNDGKYRLTGKNRTDGTDYISSDESHLLQANTEEGKNIVDWVVVDAAGYAEAMTALKNTQAATAAQTAGVTAATTEELVSAIKDWAVVKLLEGSSITTTAEKFQQGQTNPAPITIVSKEVAVSIPGLYKFSLQGFYRMRSNNENYQLHEEGLDQPAAYVYFGDTKTQICSVFDASNDTNTGCYTGADGKFYPNGQEAALTAFQSDKYVNTVWKFITQEEIDATSGIFEYGIKYQGWPNYGVWKDGKLEPQLAQWCCWAIESADITLLTNKGIEFVTDGVHSYIGNFDTATTIELTDEVPVADVQQATFAAGAPEITFTNPNGLIFARNGQVEGRNVIVNNTCAELQLSDGHPFINPTEFTATKASYTLSALAGGEFATLMLPFRASLPGDGKAYALDQSVDLISGTLRGSNVESIEANMPVVVTAAGAYTGSNTTVSAVTNNASFTNGELIGVFQTTTAPEGSYVLQNHTGSEGVAFYLVGATKPVVKPLRAYIKVQPRETKALHIIFDDDTDAIEMTTSENGRAEYYDLAGRRVAAPTTGIYISNGKKVVIK